MKRIKQAFLAALVLAVTGAAPAFAGHDDEGTCFMHRSSSGYVKICTGDIVNFGHAEERDRREYRHHYYEPVTYHHYYYGPPGHTKHKWHHKHHKHDRHCNHDHHHRHDRDDDDDDRHRHHR